MANVICNLRRTTSIQWPGNKGEGLIGQLRFALGPIESRAYFTALYNLEIKKKKKRGEVRSTSFQVLLYLPDG